MGPGVNVIEPFFIVDDKQECVFTSIVFKLVFYLWVRPEPIQEWSTFQCSSSIVASWSYKEILDETKKLRGANTLAYFSFSDEVKKKFYTIGNRLQGLPNPCSGVDVTKTFFAIGLIKIS